MAMQCNIDDRGRLFRMTVGFMLAVIGLVLLILSIVRGGTLFTWTSSIVLLLLGAFMFFEGRVGWCAVRAMGFKTRI
jgi:hypothetical protein